VHECSCINLHSTLRWCEHYTEALNHPTAPACQQLDDEQSIGTDDPDTPTDAPTLEEVVSAMKRVTSGRATGGDGISPEMLKSALMSSSVILHQLFTRVWVTHEEFPPNGKRASLCHSTRARAAMTNAAVIDQYRYYLFQARYSLTFC